jgi:class 3 adenylate cyclase
MTSLDRTIVKMDARKYTNRIQSVKIFTGQDFTHLVNEVIHQSIYKGLEAIGKKREEFENMNEKGVKNIRFVGDSAELVFESAVDAHQFVLAVHKYSEDSNKNKPEEVKLWFRISAATGYINEAPKETFYSGEVFVIACRLEPKANPGEFLIDTTTYNSLP